MWSPGVLAVPSTSLLLAVALGLMGGCAYDVTGTPAGSAGPGSAGSDTGQDLTSPCIPRQAVFCDCPDGSQGVQICGSEGQFGACDCDALVGPPGDLDAGLDGTLDGTPDGTLPDMAPPTWEPTCTTERFWDDFEDDGRPRGSPQMVPGAECVDCHRGDGPGLALGGTVFGGLHDRDNCFGVGGVTVHIIAADSRIWDLPTNASGNFYLLQERGRIEPPYTASVIGSDGEERVMVTPQTNTDCNTCHTVAGAEGASGRIVPTLPGMQ